MTNNNIESSAPVKGAWWTLSVLTFVAMLDWADRALIAATVEPIKGEFGLSDGEIGFLMGFAFVAIRVLLGLPIGRWADSYNRRNILVGSIAVWSAGTVVFGMSRNFAHLVAGRLVIGAGTAGSISPSLSMVADLFPLRRRGLAMGIWNAGSVVGYSVGLGIGAFLTQFYGWRITMYAFGLFGLIVAAIVLFGTAEPLRRDSAGKEATSVQLPSLRRVLAFMIRQRSMLHVCIGFALIMAVDMMTSFWAMTFYVRSYGLEIAQAGGYLSIMWLTGIPGCLFGGYLADRLGRNDIRWHGWLVALACVAATVSTAIIYLTDILPLALVVVAVNTFIFAITYPAMTNVSIGLFPVRMRALGYALYTVILYSGYALGPSYIGVVSDWLEPRFGVESLRYAMLSSIPFMLWAALHFWRAAPLLAADYERANSQTF